MLALKGDGLPSEMALARNDHFKENEVVQNYKNFFYLAGFGFAMVVLFLKPSVRAATSYKVIAGETRQITEYATCRTVANNHASGLAIFIPTNSSGEWTSFAGSPPSGVSIGLCFAASGGTEATTNGIKQHKFTSNGTFTVTTGTGNVEALVVGGGGGGGRFGGGGGGGGVVYIPGVGLSTQAYSVTVGGGGAGSNTGGTNGTNGSDSVFSGYTGKGGGGGGSRNASTAAGQAGNSGGSGGGGSHSNSAPAASGGSSTQVSYSGATVYGRTGGTGKPDTAGSAPNHASAGGGGAGAVGGNWKSGTDGIRGSDGGGDGGAGIDMSARFGTSVGASGWFAGGGGGQIYTDSSGTRHGRGGTGGGGNGGNDYDGTTNGLDATIGVDGTGGGGGGSRWNTNIAGTSGGRGGSGAVLIQYSIIPASCADWRSRGFTASGLYTINLNGLGDVLVYCDQTTDGGGWTLVLNYLHAGNTNPATNPSTTVFPRLGLSSLGTDESASTTTWGHAAPSLLNRLLFSSMRFYCQTSNHARVVHFKTSDANCSTYFKTGNSQSCSNLNSSYTTLTSHSANTPPTLDGYWTSQGNEAMTAFPFYRGNNYHWAVRGAGSRWECDDYQGSYGSNTLHRIWVK